MDSALSSKTRSAEKPCTATPDAASDTSMGTESPGVPAPSPASIVAPWAHSLGATAKLANEITNASNGMP